MPPTGDEEVYPFLGLSGCEQMFELVGTGTQLVVDAAAELEDALLGVGVADAAGQVYTEVDKVGAGGAGPEGGYLFLQPPREQELPGQKLPQ